MMATALPLQPSPGAGRQPVKIDMRARRASAVLMLPVALAAQSAQAANEQGGWRQIREGQQGVSAVSGQESNVLIQSTGVDWLYYRNELIAGTGAWGIALTVLVLILFFLIRGKVALIQPRENVTILRGSRLERILHWYTAVLFIVLALSGLILLLGRPYLIDLVGHESFSGLAYSAKILHNYAGPLFIIGLLAMIIIWFKDNLPCKADLDWFRALGGIVGLQHPSADRMNAGK